MKRKFCHIFLYILIQYSCLFLLFSECSANKLFTRWKSYTNSNYIKDLIVDGNNLWVAGGGITKFELNNNRETKYLREHGLASNKVFKMILIDNTLWIATANGISCYNIRRHTWKSYYKHDGLPDDAVTALVADTTTGHIWFGTWEGYLFSFNSKERKWNIPASQIRIPNTMISALAIDPKEGLLLIGTWGEGLYTYKYGSQMLIKAKLSSCQSLENVTDILMENKTLWVGTATRGLWLGNLSFGALELRKMENLSEDTITSIKKSPVGNKILITAVNRGLLIYFKNSGKWKTVNKSLWIPVGRFNTSAYDGENAFLGTEGDGVIKLNLKTGETKQYKLVNQIADNKVSVVVPDPKSVRLWVGTEGNGTAFLDFASRKWTILNSSNSVLRSDVVNCIAVDDSKDDVWIGTDDGIVKYDTRSGNYQHYGLEDGLSSILVYSSGFDRSESLWAGFYIGSPGIFDFRANKWRSVEEVPSSITYALSMDSNGKSVWMASACGIINYNIDSRKSKIYWNDIEFRSLLFDPKQQEVWAGSWGAGLFHMKANGSQQRNIEIFQDLAVLDIKEDKWQNTIWFATSSGVFRYDRKRQKFDHLDVSDGLALNFVLSVGITQDSVWFGTWGGGLSRLFK
jgi:ligand-binding sensor domain-containing protein